MRRPVIQAVIALIAGILLASQINASPFILLPLTGLLTLTAVFWPAVRASLLIPILILAGWSDYSIHTSILSRNDLRVLIGPHGRLASIRGTVNETPAIRVVEQEDKSLVRNLGRITVTEVKFQGAKWTPAVGTVAVSTPGELTKVFGKQRVEIAGVIGLPDVAIAPGTFDYRAYLNQLGIYYLLTTSSEKDWAVISSPTYPPLADRFREWARKALAMGLPQEDQTLRLEWALTVGWKQALTEEVSEPFVRAATYHIFAVDGLRMAIIFGIFFGLLRAFSVPRWLCGVILFPVIWCYVALTGWPASAIRATVMLSVIILGWVLRRPSDLINSLFVAAMIILVWQPQQLFQAGFQLSFLVVLCLILTIPIMQRMTRSLLAPDPMLPDSLRPTWQRALRRPLTWLEDITITSFAAWIGSIPLVAYYFHIVSPISTPANIIAVPLCALVLICNIASLIVAGLLPGVAVLFNHSGWFLMNCIEASSHWFAQLPKAYVYIQAPGLFAIVMYYGILLGILTGWLLQARFRLWKVAAVTFGVAVCFGLFFVDKCVPRLTVLTQPSGSSVYYNAGFGSDLLFDCGNEEAVRSVVKPFLRAQGVNHLDPILLTVGRISQMAGVPEIVEQFKTKKILTSSAHYQSVLYRSILERLEERPLVISRLEPGDSLGPWEIIYPSDDETFTTADDKPLVVWGNVRGARVLLASSLGPRGQDALIERFPGMEADILISGLPGLGEPVSQRFLDAIRPRLVIISDAKFPARARAGLKLRNRLNQASIPVLYTSDEGAATFEFRRGDWSVSTMSGVHYAGKNLKPYSISVTGENSSESF